LCITYAKRIQMTKFFLEVKFYLIAQLFLLEQNSK
jgi:hypothetical protein